MRVRMTTHITGTRDGQEWPDVGGLLEVPEAEATDLIEAGYAEEATDAPTAQRHKQAEPAEPEEAEPTEHEPEPAKRPVRKASKKRG